MCRNMRVTTLVDVLNCVQGISGEEMIMDDEMIKQARRCIDKMIELG